VGFWPPRSVYKIYMLGKVRFPDRALYLPTLSHFLIGNKTSLSALSFPLSLVSISGLIFRGGVFGFADML
jgi:hypothetical protein